MGRRGTVTLLAIVAMAAGCARETQATSFETLGVPEPAQVAGRTAVILGWAREDRADWAIDRVRINGRVRPEWDAATQRPAVFYLRPGPRVLRIYSRRGDAGDQLVRSRPVQIDAVADAVVVCRARVEGAESPLPRLACEPRDPGPVAATAGPATPGPEAEPGPTPPAADQRVLDRLQAIEDRLARLEELLRARLPQQGDRGPEGEPQRSLSIDTTPPW